MSEPKLNAPDVEAALLGAVIQWPANALPMVQTAGGAVEWFTSETNKNVWETVVAKALASEPIDPNMMELYIRQRYAWNAQQFIANAVAKAPDIVNLHAWCTTLQEMLMKRELNNTLLNGQAQLATEADAGQIAIVVRNDLNRIGSSAAEGSRTAVIDSIMADVQGDGGKENYVKSYLPWFAEKCHGYHRGQPVVLGADPKTGKTTILVQELVLGALAGEPRGLISLEMKARDVYYLAAGIVSGVDCFRLKTKQAHQSEKDAWSAALRRVKESPFHVVDNAMTYDQVMRAYFDLSLNYGCTIVGGDYFQLMKQTMKSGGGREKTRFDFMETASNGFVSANKQLGNVLFWLSQLRKEGNKRGEKKGSDKDNQPTEHDLDGTGSLARDSHTTLLMSAMREPQFKIYDPVNHKPVMCNVALNRGGKTPEIPLVMIRNQQRFVSAESYTEAHAAAPSID